MEVILKTITRADLDTAQSIISRVLDKDNENLFSSQERGVFQALDNMVKQAGSLPSEEYLLKTFPEYTVPLSKSEPISSSDLKMHFMLLLQKRNNQNASRVLMEAARQTTESGFTYEIADKIHGIRVVDEAELTEEDSTSSAQSFKEFYQRKKSQSTGLLTFVKEIDEKIGGLPLGGCSVLFGYVAQFKSLMANNIAYGNAKKLNYNIVIVSLEVSKEDVLINLLSRHSYDPKFAKYPAIAHQKIRTCALSEEEESYLMDVIAPDFYSQGGKIIILDETKFSTFSFAEIRSKLEEADDECIRDTGYGIDAVIWDHANLFKFNSSKVSKQNEGSEINEYVSFIRKLSIKFRRMPGEKDYRKIHSLILAQANREGYKRAHKLKGVYDLRAISEANELERGAQQIFSIYTNEDLKVAKEATMQILKNRTGATMVDPCSIFVDPVNYVAGEEVEGFNEMINMEELGDLFSGGSDMLDMFE